MRAARVAGLLWVAYLPLAAFTHLLWNESLFLAFFLPSIYQCLAVLQAEEGERVDGRLVMAGLGFAAALYLKEAPTYLVPAIALLLVPFAGGALEGLRRAALLIGVTFVAVLPWCLRNLEVYGHFALADSMGISHALARGPRGLSQGERQRVAICRALVTEPKLVMCDEPTGNLDPATAGTTLDLLFDRVSERAATLLMVTHNHGILGRFDRVLDITDLGSAS